jgi:hypothetical protein
MDDKTFQYHESAESCTSRRERMTTEEWLAPLDREIEKLEEILEENARIFGLPPLDQPLSASNSRR